jgi:hypothetical protein
LVSQSSLRCRLEVVGGEEMSMRATFTTEFIYDGIEGFDDRKDKMMEVLEAGENKLNRNNHMGNMIGQIAGITHGLDLEESDIKRWIEEQYWDLCRITKVPFKIVWLLEGGDTIVKQVSPLSQTK